MADKSLSMPRDARFPTPYDLTDATEAARLLREVWGYMEVSRSHGSDTKGRAFAIDALRQIVREGWTLVPPAQN